MEFVQRIRFDFKNENSADSVYVTNLETNGDCFAASGDGMLKVYDCNKLKATHFFGTGQKSLGQISFSAGHKNLLCFSTPNGYITAIDTRTQSKRGMAKSIFVLESKPIGNNKFNARLHSCAWTQDNTYNIVGGGVNNLYLWDIRQLKNSKSKKSNNCAILNDFHTDTITKLRFENQRLYSCSEDGLINEYNLNAFNPNANANGGNSEMESDDVLSNVWYCEKPLGNFGLFTHINAAQNTSDNCLFGIANDSSLYVHKYESSQKVSDDSEMKVDSNDGDTLLCEFNRQQMSNMIAVDCYYHTKSAQLRLMSTSEFGKIRISEVRPNGIQCMSEYGGGNQSHNSRIRCGLQMPNSDMYISGGEDNSICVWRFDSNKASFKALDESQLIEADTQLKDFLQTDTQKSNGHGYGPQRGRK